MILRLREEVVRDTSFQVITVLVDQLVILFGFLRRVVDENECRKRVHYTAQKLKTIS
jgi:hypothetical protein